MTEALSVVVLIELAVIVVGGVLLLMRTLNRRERQQRVEVLEDRAEPQLIVPQDSENSRYAMY
ncbi:hypothetical protein, partial [Thalassospira sp. CH_XMU1420-2]|uniref:hypothetical protein n=1 Tax=Thalassospira sp. CH_XMU1420-2 TaxID=3107769 RepID=UPI003008EE5B